jgi:hypothetical protein
MSVIEQAWWVYCSHLGNYEKTVLVLNIYERHILVNNFRNNCCLPKNEIRTLMRYLYSYVHSSITLVQVEAMFTAHWQMNAKQMRCVHTMKQYSALERKTWHMPYMEEPWGLDEISSPKKINPAWFYLYEVPRAANLQKESRTWFPEAREGKKGVVTTEFQYRQMKMFWRWAVVTVIQQCEYTYTTEPHIKDG